MSRASFEIKNGSTYKVLFDYLSFYLSMKEFYEGKSLLKKIMNQFTRVGGSEIEKNREKSLLANM